MATAITRKCLEYAKKKGAKVARLVTRSNNKAAQTVLKKLGFKPIAEFVEMVTEDIKDERSKSQDGQKKTKQRKYGITCRTQKLTIVQQVYTQFYFTGSRWRRQP